MTGKPPTTQFFREKQGLPAGPWVSAGIGYATGLGIFSSTDARVSTVAVAIRMKRMGRKNREYYRICATDRRSPRDGRVIEELGTYDPHVGETDARCTLDAGRVDYWLSVGAQPSDNVRVLIKKYGTGGTHLQQMEEARARLKLPRVIPDAGPPAFVPEVKAPEPAPQDSPTAEATPAEHAEPAAVEPAAEEAKSE